MRAIDILELFDETRRVLTVAEMCELTGLTTSTAYRLARALTSRGMLTTDDAASVYRLGPQILRLARAASSTEISDIVRPALLRLHEASGETTSLFVRAGTTRRTCLMEVPSSQPIRIVSGVGNTYPLTRGAAGKAICALVPESGLSLILDEQANEHPLDAASLDAVRAAGYAQSVGETIPGAAAIAAAFTVEPPTSPHSPIYAINVTGPADRFNKSRRVEIAKLLVQLTRQLSGTSPVSSIR
jgi:DNA-binding IclR family transcriptional regulator